MSLTANQHSANRPSDSPVASTRRDAGSRRALAGFRGAGIILVAFLGTGVLVAACGGGSSPRAAQSASTPSPSNRALAFVNCMRTHGQPNLSDPTNEEGHVTISISPSIATSPQFTAGWSACKHLARGDGGSFPGPTITPTDQADYRKAAACMRSHGFPTFPDPVFQTNSALSAVKFNIPSSIDRSSPPFKSAATTCDKLIPAGLPYSSPTAS